MKIDRAKLNTLLKSGLNSEVKTRKHLAERLGLDPTSLTRWFASRDRLGNPRYPVVPDRHVTNILKVFDLSADLLGLDQEKFRQHCFDVALLRAEENDEANQKALLRLENIARRKLTVPTQVNSSRPMVYSILLIGIVIVGIVYWWFNQYPLNQQESKVIGDTTNAVSCWTGYSDPFGDYDEEDEADPCHYGKLFHNALAHLKAHNENGLSSQTNQNRGVEEEYILFLSKQLEQRKIKQQIELNIELGRRQLDASNYAEALVYFNKAEKILDSSATQNAQLKSKLFIYISAALAAELPPKTTVKIQ